MALAARRADRLKELQSIIKADGGKAEVVVLDVSSAEGIKDAVNEAERKIGPIEILVNNSGVTLTKKLVDVEPEEFDFVMSTNTRGAFLVAKEVGKRMIARYASTPTQECRIINIVSVGAFAVEKGIGVYCASKAALLHLTKAMALEWGNFGINVNAICPGYIRTELNDAFFETAAGQRLIQTLPRRRLGTPSDLDAVLLLLASNKSRTINGAAFTVDDGFLIA